MKLEIVLDQVIANSSVRLDSNVFKSDRVKASIKNESKLTISLKLGCLERRASACSSTSVGSKHLD